MIYIISKNIGDFRGGAVVARDILDTLYESGFDVSAVSVGYNISNEYSDRFTEIPHIKMPYITKKNDYPDNLRGAIRYRLKRLEYYIRWLNMKLQFMMKPPKIIMLNDTFLSTRHIRDNHKELSPLIQIVHVSPTFVKSFFGDYSLENYLEDFSKADVLLFVSEACRTEWIELGIVDEKKTYYIPNCANEAEAKSYLNRSKEATRKGLKLESDSFYLVNVGSVKKWKGQDILIEAAPELKKIAPNLEILLIGPGDGTFKSELAETIEQKEMDYVHFLGLLSNAKEYIYASDLFVLPSRAEAFPLVLLEAMILKTPMMGSNVDGIPEIIKHEQTGLLFEGDNVNELVNAFEKMYRSNENRAKYAEQALKKYNNDFSKEQFTKRYASLIEQVLKDERF